MDNHNSQYQCINYPMSPHAVKSEYQLAFIMSAASAESLLTYSFTYNIPATIYAEKITFVEAGDESWGDKWELLFVLEAKCCQFGLTLIRRNTRRRDDNVCYSYNVRFSFLDGERQSLHEDVRTGWKHVGEGIMSCFCVDESAKIRKRCKTLQITVTKIPNSSARIKAQELAILFKSESFGDLVIECEDEEKLHCHRGMLAAKSPVFAAMFNAEMKESVENRIRMKEFSSGVVSLLLQFCYLGTWEDFWCDADSLYVAADRYQLLQLKLAATAHLLSHINVTSIVPTLRLAHLYKDKSLEDGCVEYMASHKSSVSMLEMVANATKH